MAVNRALQAFMWRRRFRRCKPAPSCARLITRKRRAKMPPHKTFRRIGLSPASARHKRDTMAVMLSRREWLTGAAATTAIAQTGPGGARPPNVVLFLADDLGCHDLGCWGASELKTPTLDPL